VALSELSSHYPGALVVMEAGCHSPWVSRHLEQAGCEVIVSNPRKTRAIYQHERKSDRRDALMLARIARMEPALLYPVRHGSEEAQQDLLRIKLRDSLVRARVGLINSLRFTLKSLGYAMANPSTERFHKAIKSALPESIVQMIAPSVQAIEELSLRIKLLDREIRTLAHTGPFAPPSALRQYGLARATGATARAKKRAVVAVARKLAVLLLTLWKTKSAYQAFPRQCEKMRTLDLERLRCIA
jgi:transposase